MCLNILNYLESKMKIDTLLSYVSQILNAPPCLSQEEQSTNTHSTGTLQEELINMIQQFKMNHTEISDEHIESIRIFIDTWKMSISQVLYLALTQLCETLSTEYTNTLPIPELSKELTWQAPKYCDRDMHLGSQFRYLPESPINIDKMIATAKKSAKY